LTSAEPPSDVRSQRVSREDCMLAGSPGRPNASCGAAHLPSRSRSDSPPPRQSHFAPIGDQRSRTYVATPAATLQARQEHRSSSAAPGQDRRNTWPRSAPL